jgi:outer membrane murein-binding lipoprotein Lpp
MRGVGELRHRWQALSVIALAVMLLSGCASIEGYPNRLEYAAQYVAEVGPYAAPDAVLRYNATTDLTSATLLRNNIVTARIFSIDANFHQFVRDLTTQQNLSSVGIDWAAIGLASAGAVVGSSQTKAILAAISAGLLGAKASVDKDVFYNKTIPALITLMEGQRKIVLAQIYVGLRKGAADYTLYQALADLDSYYNAGTINGALVGLTVTAGASSQAGSDQIAAVLSSNFSVDDSSQKLRKFWKPDGTINIENQTKLKNWMKANGVDPGSISFFIYSDMYAAKRSKAVSDLKIQ